VRTKLVLKIGSGLTLDPEGTAAKVVLAVEEVIVVLAYDRDDRRAGYPGQRRSNCVRPDHLHCTAR
jgi:hypothetical protein